MDGDTDMMQIVPLGGGQEVGRSCIVLKFKGRNILLDCGIHPGRDGSNGLPFFDACDDLEEIEIVLITHFHLDHCASLPYFTEKTNFKGRIFMTHATKAVMRLLLADNVKLQARPLYSEAELQACMDKCEVVDYHQTVDVRGVKFTASPAGHVLGAAMFSINIGGIKVLYTGDYSMEEDRHLSAAEVPNCGTPDVLIVESTFGVQELASKEERESRFTSTVETIVRGGGNCLIPVFALGRAQELLLILEEYWLENPDLQGVPVFYASRMASKALKVYQTFVNQMNRHIRDLTDICNPFRFNYVKTLLSASADGGGALGMGGPSVVMASPGFMQNGVSRELFERWCEDAKNGVIIAGYTVENTLAHDLLSNPTEITCLDNRVKPRRCSIEHVSFSAHVDYVQNLAFIRSMLPDNIILVHGEQKAMGRLKTALEREISREWASPDGHRPPVVGPANGFPVKIPFQKRIEASIVGKASTALVDSLQCAPRKPSTAMLPPRTVLVTENFVSKVVAAEELQQFTSCRLGSIMQRIHVPVPIGYVKGGAAGSNSTNRGSEPASPLLEAVLPYLEDVMDLVEWKHAAGELGDPSVQLLVRDLVWVKDCHASNSLLVEWAASPAVDMVADCVVGTLYQALSVPSMLRATTGTGAVNRDASLHGPSTMFSGACSTGTTKGSNRGPAAAGSKKRGKQAATKAGDGGVVKVTGDGAGQSSVGGEGSARDAGADLEAERAADRLVKKLRLGLVNPRNAIARDILEEVLQAQASSKAAGSGGGCAKKHGGAAAKDPATASKAEYAQRLRNMRTLLQERCVHGAGSPKAPEEIAALPFESVKLNANQTCLIVRGRERKRPLDSAATGGGDDIPLYESPEAFCFFVFNAPQGAGTEKAAAGEGESDFFAPLHNHHAVVQCDDEDFRAVVVRAMSSFST